MTDQPFDPAASVSIRYHSRLQFKDQNTSGHGASMEGRFNPLITGGFSVIPTTLPSTLTRVYLDTFIPFS